MKAVIYPLEKVVLGDISITFGMKKSEAERLLGKATAVGESTPFCNGRRRCLWLLYAMIQKKDEKQSRPFCYLHLFHERFCANGDGGLLGGARRHGNGEFLGVDGERTAHMLSVPMLAEAAIDFKITKTVHKILRIAVSQKEVIASLGLHHDAFGKELTARLHRNFELCGDTLTAAGLDIERRAVIEEVNGDLRMEVLYVDDLTLGVVHLAPVGGLGLFVKLRTVARVFIANELEAVCRGRNGARAELRMRVAEEGACETNLKHRGTVVHLEKDGRARSKTGHRQISFGVIDSGDTAVREEAGLILCGRFRRDFIESCNKLGVERQQGQHKGRTEVKNGIAIFIMKRICHIRKFGIFIDERKQEIIWIVGRNGMLAAVIPTGGIERVDRIIGFDEFIHQVQISARIFKKFFSVKEISHDHEGIVANVIVGACGAFGIFAVFIAVDALHEEALDGVEKFLFACIAVSDRKTAGNDPTMIGRMEAERRHGMTALFEDLFDLFKKPVLLGGMLGKTRDQLRCGIDGVNVEARLSGVVKVCAKKVIRAVLVNIGFIMAKPLIRFFQKNGVAVARRAFHIIRKDKMRHIGSKGGAIRKTLVGRTRCKEDRQALCVVHQVVDVQIPFDRTKKILFDAFIMIFHDRTSKSFFAFILSYSF